MKRSKILSLLGALVLTMGVVGIAFANTLSEDHPAQTGNAVSGLATQDCSDFTGDFAVGEGEVGLHFILTQPESETGNISGSVDSTAFGPVAGIFHGNSENGAMHFYVIVPGDGDSVIDDATTDIDGGQLTLSHVCVGETVETAPPSTGPSFSGGEQELTEPPTDTFTANGTSNPADSAWLLVVALGVLLASIVVLTPARAKSRR